MKEKPYTNPHIPRRITLRSLLIYAFTIVFIFSFLFACGFRSYLYWTINKKCEEAVTSLLNECLLDIHDRYEKHFVNANGGKATDPTVTDTLQKQALFMQEIQARLAMLDYYMITLEDPLYFHPSINVFDENGKTAAHVKFTPPSTFTHSDDCLRSYAALIAENDKIVCNSHLILVAWITFNPSEQAELYICDNSLFSNPDIEKLFERYLELSESGDNSNSTCTFSSYYVNRTTHTFIPHEGIISFNDESIEDLPVHVTIDDPDYELTQAPKSYGEYPRSYICFYGENPDKIAEIELCEPCYYNADENIHRSSYSRSIEKHKKLFVENSEIYINDVRYWLTVRMTFDYNNPILTRYYWKYVIIICALLSMIALLWVWRKNVINKARYAFEDHQRALTDQLAHDIKTPLMAISGYAENALNNILTKQEHDQYLSSIIDNVAFIDALLSRTLHLNHMGEKKPTLAESVNLEQLTQSMLKRYELLLNTKKITHSISGSASIKADPAALETIIENLISNAVKYTPDRGSVTVSIEKKHMTICNSVLEKIDTTDLKCAFVRGDKARSNMQGTGLGLSIADHAASVNGIQLNLSCTDSTFTAELNY